MSTKPEIIITTQDAERLEILLDSLSSVAFAAKAGLTYPSLTDESGLLILELQGKAPTVPTTLVLDPQGRIAARIAGTATEVTLTGLIDDVLAEA